ncbi:MAG TPA: hypothetical protein VHN36_16735, partial [Ilumatobacteraceae bacterium]|nr:hypothetical protein [Ilumatobacteraceae bacterium]
MRVARPSLVRLLGVVLVTVVGVSACGSDNKSSAAGAQLSLVAYSTPQAAYEKIITAFNATPQGKNV